MIRLNGSNLLLKIGSRYSYEQRRLRSTPSRPTHQQNFSVGRLFGDDQVCVATHHSRHHDLFCGNFGVIA